MFLELDDELIYLGKEQTFELKYDIDKSECVTVYRIILIFNNKEITLYQSTFKNEAKEKYNKIKYLLRTETSINLQTKE